MKSMQDPLIGTLFAGRYRADLLVGRSAMSVVYKAMDTQTNTVVAVKLLNGVLLSDQESLQRFHREAQIARSLMHPNVCTLLDHGVTSEGIPYHVMEFIPGDTLDHIIEQNGAMNPIDALTIFGKICRAVQYLHSRGIVHRDLKPGNVMIPSMQPPAVKVIDFGVAKGTRAGVHEEMELTRPGEVYGSLLYTPPERLIGQPADARSDIYSIGCSMYEVLTGTNPFSADGPTKIAEKQLKLQPEPLLKYGVTPEVSALLTPVVLKALDKDPNGRYQTAAELRDAIEAVESHVKIAFTRSDPQRQSQIIKKRKRPSGFRRFAVFAACAIAAVIAIYYTIQFIQNAWDHGFSLPFGL